MLELQTIASQDYEVLSDFSQMRKIEPKQLEHKRYLVVLENHTISELLSVTCLSVLMANGINDPEKIIHCSRVRFVTLPLNEFTSSLEQLKGEIVILIDEQGHPAGIIENIEAMKHWVKLLENEQSEFKKTVLEYETIFESLDEEIFITDQDGTILRLNSAAEQLFGLKRVELIGRHVSELVKRNIISASSTEAVLEQKCKVNIMQEQFISGKRYIGTAIPIFDEDGQLIRVVSTSKDIDQINRLKSELDKKETELGLRERELHLLKNEIFSQNDFIYVSEAMHSIKEGILKITDTDMSVLITGESGVGKEVVAKAVHYAGKRRNKPFIKINCGLIPENLLESELFGYEKGAFTGADKKGKIGKVELANGGTLFLDEIGEMPLTLQVKLLEFLQDKQICRVGGTNSISIDTRIVAATNCDLQEMVKKKLFRLDLYYRLNIMTLEIPPLCARKEDINILSEFFKQKINSKYGLTKRFSQEVKDALYRFDWPGNVRELEHVIERIMVMADSDLVELKDLGGLLNSKSFECNSALQNALPSIMPLKIIPLKAAKAKVEEELIYAAYLKCHSTYKAAELLEVDQSTVVKLMKKYRIKDRMVTSTTQ